MVRRTKIMTTPVFYSGFGFIPVGLLVLSGIADLIFGLDTNNESVMGIGIMACGILTGIACLILNILVLSVSNLSWYQQNTI